jgi:hypothetical protein
MGSLLGGLMDRVVLVAGTLAGGCVPGFVVQYRQRVGGRLDQVIADLAPFREIADRFHGGSLDELISHHLASSDATFHAEGAAIQAMVDAEQRLRGMYEALQGGIWEQLAYLIPHADAQIMRDTWGAWVPTITLDGQGLAVAVLIGVPLWLAYLAVARGVALVLRRLR